MSRVSIEPNLGSISGRFLAFVARIWGGRASPGGAILQIYLSLLLACAALAKLGSPASSYSFAAIELLAALAFLLFRERAVSLLGAACLYAVFLTVSVFNVVFQRSCQCFGDFQLNPLWMLSLNLLAFAAIIYALMPDLGQRSLPRVAAHLSGLMVIALAFGGMALSSTSMPASTDAMSVRERHLRRELMAISSGKTLLIVDPWCTECQEVISELISRPSDHWMNNLLVVVREDDFTNEFRRFATIYRVEIHPHSILFDNAIPRLLKIEENETFSVVGAAAIIRELNSKYQES